MLLKSKDNQNIKCSLTKKQVSAFRMHRHHLINRAPLTSLEKVVGDVCGIQTQLMSSAQIALWTRIQDLTPEHVDRALFQKRTIVKTWCMRGTVHLLQTTDLPIYVGALKQSGLRASQHWLTRHGVSQKEVENMVSAIVKVLAHGPLTRQELTKRVVAFLGPKVKRWIEHSWGDVVKQVCLQGLACFGPNYGQNITFVRLDHWLTNFSNLSAEEAKTILFRRYLQGYGPATLQDFAAWSGMSVKETRLIMEQLENEVYKVNIDGQEALLIHRDLAEIQALKISHKTVRLLPSFDPYMLGHRNKDHIVDKLYYKQVYRKAGWLSPVVLINGRVMATWRYEHHGRRLFVTVTPFDNISRSHRDSIEQEVKDLGRFLGSAFCKVIF